MYKKQNAMFTRELLLQSPRFVMHMHNKQTSLPERLPERVHAAFLNSQPFLYDRTYDITLHPGLTDWIICDVDNPEHIRLISYETFFDNYQPESNEGWKYLSNLFISKFEAFSDFPAMKERVVYMNSTPDSWGLKAPEAAGVEFNADQYVMEERLVCECGGHELSVRTSGDMDGDIEIAFWKLGHRTYKPNWVTRLRQIWDILIKGHAYSDMVILNQADQAKLVNIISQSRDLSERYKTAYAEWLASHPKPKQEVVTIQEVAELQASHEAEKQELLEIIKTLSAKLQPQSNT